METLRDGKNTNTVEVKCNCIACGKKDCDDYIKIDVILPIHSEPKCVVKNFYKIMQINNNGSPNIDSLSALKKLLSEVSANSSHS